MYNLVACYDTLELKSRGDVLSDKVSSVLPSMQAMFEMEEKAPIYTINIAEIYFRSADFFLPPHLANDPTALKYIFRERKQI